MTKNVFALVVAAVVAGAGSQWMSPRVGAQSAELPKPGFHHLHMNSPNPSAAIGEFVKVYPGTTKAAFGEFEGLRTENGVLMLFTKVNRAPAVQGPDRDPASAPLTAFWHHVWGTRDGRALIKSLRASDPKFDQTRKLPLYSGPDGKVVDFSSDALPGNLTNRELEAAKAKGAQPTHRGGYFNWYGPDGVIVETTDQNGTGPEAYRIIGMFQEQPYCALFWYQKHLNAGDAEGGGRGGGRGGRGGDGPPPGGGPPAPTSEANCKVTRSDDVSWPSTYKRGHARVPEPQRVIFGDVTLRWYMNQENRPITTTRGQVMDHIALSVTNLDAWVAKLKSENVKFLEQPYKLGNARAVLIEGPSLEALELVESQP